MKKILSYIMPAFFIAGLYSCGKNIVENDANYPTLNPVNQDYEAKSWAPFILESFDELPVPEPAEVSSAAYQKEVNDLKAFSNLTAEQKRVVDYWKVGSVLRWNEIMRALVAKHNLPPYQNPDGTYPVPKATNPFDYPTFPFSNPPYASRAYAYVSIAHYDALIAAWHFKAKYNRSAPYKTDESLNVLVSKTDLPAYPSEDAVIAGASFEIMKLLFPGDIDFIQKMAEEEKNYRLWSGANVMSDIVAGDSLGRWVARKIVQRAKTDGMGAAGGTSEVWAKMEQDCLDKGEIPWYSMESPRRPPMLPLFGNVKPILFKSEDIAQLRPGPPPAVNSEQMQKELDEIYSYTKNPTREHMRIVNFWADGVGTSTPSGHWGLIAEEEFVKQNLSEVRWARNYALLNSALMDAAIICWNTKYYYYNPRPCQLDPKIKTVTGLPNFPAYISGHSTFSGAASTVLGHLIPAKAKVFDNMALEASNSRIYGGIHYRSDCMVGLDVGKKVGGYAIAKSNQDQSR
jgi:hypothetical protein